MRQFLLLPSSLLLLIAATGNPSSANEVQWPYNLPKDARYYPEDEPLVRRDIEISQRLLYQKPVGMRKMSNDEGEKFFMEYWLFEEDIAETAVEQTNATETVRLRLRPNQVQEKDEARNWANDSLSCAPRPAFPLHYDKDPPRNLHILGRRFQLPRALERRDFQCPGGTSACTNISRPDSCCAAGEICQLITPTSLGDVGCCTEGQTCSSQLSGGCDEGLTSCPNGGGCCIPGYECSGVGCVYVSTATVLLTPTVTVTTRSSSSSSSPSPSPRISTSTRVIVVPPSVTSTTTSTSTSTLSTTSSIQRPASTCTSGFQSCSASLGGGCCPTDMICGTSRLCFSSTTTSTSATTTEQVQPPYGRTSNSPKSSSINPGPSCPTNFYACSAFYGGGCCHTLRNCDSTSCPPTSSTTVINTHGVTAVAPVGSGISGNQAAPTGTCHNGWISCAAEVNGGCCPGGYACGTATCSPSASGGAPVGKAAASGGEGSRIGKLRALAVGLVAIGVGTLLI